MGLFNFIMDMILGERQQDPKIIKMSKEFMEHIKKDGLEYSSQRIAEIINQHIYSKDIAKQFVLEELDAARIGGSRYAKNFIKESGFKSFEYTGAMNKTKWEGEVSELEYLQQYFRSFIILITDVKLREKFALCVVDKIMKMWNLGKYNH